MVNDSTLTSGGCRLESKAMPAFLKHILDGQNQFASGGLLLMILGSIGVFLRSLPQRLWWWLEAQTTMMVTVKDDDDAFVWVKEWFLEQEFLGRVRRVDLDTTLRGAELALIPAPGRHWFWRARSTVLGMVLSQHGKQEHEPAPHGIADVPDHRSRPEVPQGVCR
jgi:hypothetical protein